VEIDKRFVEYLLELSDGVTGRIIEVLRRAAFQGLADKSHGAIHRDRHDMVVAVVILSGEVREGYRMPIKERSP
jgi:hypothetical protein